MNVLIGCECSGIIREAFREQGHNATSCDLKPTEIPGQHIQDDIRKIVQYKWDLIICHPPCTYLSNAGQHWKYKDPTRHELINETIEFWKMLWELCNSQKICFENPIGIISTTWRKPDQIIQPWWFGDPEIKRTALWLKNLPKLNGHCFEKPNTKGWTDKKRNPTDRSRTFQGIGKAMAKQWGKS